MRVVGIYSTFRVRVTTWGVKRCERVGCVEGEDVCVCGRHLQHLQGQGPRFEEVLVEK